MRDLTKEELALAPDWATHYEIVKGGYIIFESDMFSVWYDSKLNRFDKKNNNEFLNDLSESKMLPKKPFHISEHGLGDNDIDEVEIIDGTVRLHLMTNDLPYIELSKGDAIAIAKALGVTGGDLL